MALQFTRLRRRFRRRFRRGLRCGCRCGFRCGHRAWRRGSFRRGRRRCDGHRRAHSRFRGEQRKAQHDGSRRIKRAPPAPFPIPRRGAVPRRAARRGKFPRGIRGGEFLRLPRRMELRLRQKGRGFLAPPIFRILFVHGAQQLCTSSCGNGHSTPSFLKPISKSRLRTRGPEKMFSSGTSATNFSVTPEAPSSCTPR